MASSESKFSHITVHADDDEFVIQAGARASAAEEPTPQPVAPSAPSEPQPEQAAKPRATAPRPTKKSSGNEYRETTAEDLKAEPMSKMQKVIIAVALLVVVGFAVSYMISLR